MNYELEHLGTPMEHQNSLKKQKGKYKDTF